MLRAMTQDRLQRMKHLLAALGGADVVRARLSLSKASMKAALGNRVFPPAWFGPMADLAAALPEPPAIPADLFGASPEKAWPARDLIIPPSETAA